MSRVTAYRAECSACRATGVYQGFCEGKHEAVECLQCGGTGCETVSFVPFTHRRRRRGIKTVRKSRGTFIATGVGGTGEAEAYRDWFKRTEKLRDEP